MQDKRVLTPERESRMQLDAFKRRMRNAPAVQHCYFPTGEADLNPAVMAKDIKEYEEFTQAYVIDDSNVNACASSIVMDRVKASLDFI